MYVKNKIDNLNYVEFEKKCESYYAEYSGDKLTRNKILFKAYSLKKYDFIANKLKTWLESEKEISREDNEILSMLIHSNMILNKHSENYEIYLKYSKKIRWNSEFKRLILHRIEYSLYFLGYYDLSLSILEEIRKYSDKDFKNYIECLIKTNNFDKAINNLKKYIPITDEGKIWKAITYAEFICETGRIKELKKYLKKAEDSFLKYRITDEEIPNSQYYYLIGILYAEIGDNVKAINYLRLSKNNISKLTIDIKYNSMAVEKLKEMEA